jgi:hypothetical protein
MHWDKSFKHHRKKKSMKAIISFAALAVVVNGFISPAQAQLPWSALPGGCGSTDNNFYSGTPSSDYPVARFKVSGGSLSFNALHEGYIAVICNVDNPRLTGVTTAFQLWNRLQVTYRDPDGLQKLQGFGTEYQAFVQLVRVEKDTGVWQSVAQFDSNLQCTGTTVSCQGDNTIKSIDVPFTHTFDFNNYAYSVYVRLYRALSQYNLNPAVYQVRLEAASPVVGAQP